MDFWATCRQLGCSDAETERMTPRKMWALIEKRREERSIAEIPLAQISTLLYNANRSPGDPDRGVQPAPYLDIDHFCVFRTKKAKKLASQMPNPGGPHMLLGAETDRGHWESYSKKSKRLIVLPSEVRTRRK